MAKLVDPVGRTGVGWGCVMYQGPVHGTRKIAVVTSPLSGMKSFPASFPASKCFIWGWCHFAYKHGKRQLPTGLGLPEARR